MRTLTRRHWLTQSLAFGSVGMLGGCEDSPRFSGLYAASDLLTFEGQRLLLAHQPLAREFRMDQVSAVFPTMNTTNPRDDAYQRSKAAGFADWRLPVKGLVEHPTALSLADLRAMASRTQVTLHSCEQGWSAIGGWTGVQLSRVLVHVGIKPAARFVVVRTVDGWWDSYDMLDALHPQTILAYAMNGHDLPIAHGAPVRLRIERQLGYKNLKYLSSIEAVDRVDGIGQGRGSMVSELGFAWYAGI